MPNGKKNPKAGSRMQSVEGTNVALDKEVAEAELKEQESLRKSGESNALEAPLPKIVSVEDRLGSSVSTELELGSDGRWSTLARAGRKYLSHRFSRNRQKRQKSLNGFTARNVLRPGSKTAPYFLKIQRSWEWPESFLMTTNISQRRSKTFTVW
jgi:hypothetical protein